MKCFEITKEAREYYNYWKLTVNMKCFEIKKIKTHLCFYALINRKHEMF